MFKFLKEKLKGVVSQISEEIEEKGAEEVKEVAVEKPVEEKVLAKEEKKGFFAKLKEKFTKKEEIEKIPEEKVEEEFEEIPLEKLEEEVPPEEKKIKNIVDIEKAKERAGLSVKEKIEKKEIPSVQEMAERKPEIAVKPEELKKEEQRGFFGKLKQAIVTKKINEKQFEDLFWNLEIILLENNVAVEVIEKIKENLKQKLVDNPIPRGSIEKTISDSLKQTIETLFDVEKLDILEKAERKKPLIICFVGINGSGKTTTIAKMVKLFQNNRKSCVIAAADTFRAAAIDQLQKHADALKVKLIKHDYGSDAAAVAFDAVKHAQAKNVDVVLIDTAGRMHSNVNLMDEMRKIIRVANPDLKIFVGESITGNDCTEQAKKFNDIVGIDGIVLSKADVDEKGGAAISVSYVTGKPILFLGTGQNYEDLKEFDPAVIINSLGL